MREIEVKAVLTDKESFLKKASEKGIIFGDPIIQEDVTYETTVPYSDPLWNIFRIRKQGEKALLTMKYKASNRSRDNHERETVVEDAGQVEDMLERVGYSLGVRIRKTRRTAHYKGLELCLDEIDELGTFVEVEKLSEEDADVDSIQSQLWSLLVDLGVGPEDRTHKGYDTMMHELVKSNPQSSPGGYTAVHGEERKCLSAVRKRDVSRGIVRQQSTKHKHHRSLLG